MSGDERSLVACGPCDSSVCVCVEAGLVGPLMSGCMIEYSHHCRSQPGSVREREVAGA